MAAQKRLPGDGGFPSKFKRPKPCAVRDFPRNCGPNTGTHPPVKCSSKSSPSNSSSECGPSKPNTGTHSPVLCSSVFERESGSSKPNTGTHSVVKGSSAFESSPSSFLEDCGPLASGTNRGRSEEFNAVEKPCAVRDFPRNCGPNTGTHPPVKCSSKSSPSNSSSECGPSKPNTGTHSPVLCSSVFERESGRSKPNTGTHSVVKGSSAFESSPSSFPEDCGPLASGTNRGRSEEFNAVEKPKILDDIAEELASENEQKLMWETALEKVAEVIALASEFIAILDGKCSTSENLTDIAVFAVQKKPLMEAAKTVEGVGGKILSEFVDEQKLGEKVSEIRGEGIADMKLKRVQEKNVAGLEIELEDPGDESVKVEGEGVGGKILSKCVDGQNLDEKASEKVGEGGANMNLRRVREKNDTEEEMEWEDLGDDIYVLSPQDLKLWQICFKKRFRAKALMAENQANLMFDGEGVDMVGSKGTEIIVLEDDDSDGEVSVSEKNGKNCCENLQEPEFLDSDQYKVEKEQDESMDNFATDDNLTSVEFKDTCDDEPKYHQILEELVNLCIVQHDQPEGYKVTAALTKFEDHYKALKKERKAEKGGEQKRKTYAHIEAAERVKAEGMCISVQKPFGHIPGIEIGDTFRFRAQLAVVGLHRQWVSGIDYVTIGEEKFATCVVDSGRYENEAKTNDCLIYSGQGGNPKLSDKAADQKLEKGNLAMVNSMDMGYPVRFIRKRMSQMTSNVFGHFNDAKYVYVYDGLYTVTRYWQERDQNGCLVFKFELIRMPGQPRPCRTVAKSGKLLPRKEICIIDDISRGQENRPIRAVNGIDDLRPPPFTYINKNIYLDWYMRDEPIGCYCINGCSDSHQCPCVVRNGGEIPFNEKGSIVRPRPVIYECGPNCKCPPSCMNRVSQHGPKYQLEIFKTKERGWGLRSRNYVTSGSFICEYIGELLHEKEAEQRIGEDEYLFDIGDGHDEDGDHDAFAIDAGKFGNVGRFVNHSCSPNMYAQEVLYDYDDETMPHIMFFATRNIPALQELTYDYNYKIDRVCDANGNIKKKHCFCGSRECNGRMY